MYLRILIFILPVSAANSDSLWSSNDDLLFPDTDLSLIQPTLPYDQTAVTSPFELAELPPLNLQTSPTDSSLIPLENTNWDNNLFSSTSGGDELALSLLPADYTILDDNVFETADCSPSDFLPAIGKSRARRGEQCRAPTKPPVTGSNNPKSPSGSGDPPIDFSGLNDLLKNPLVLQKFKDARSNNDHNTFCYLFTAGYLPYGTCSSGKAEDETRSGQTLSLGRWPALEVVTLHHCTNAPGLATNCPGITQDLYCCQYSEVLLDPTYALGCVLWSELLVFLRMYGF